MKLLLLSLFSFIALSNGGKEGHHTNPGREIKSNHIKRCVLIAETHANCCVEHHSCHAKKLPVLPNSNYTVIHFPVSPIYADLYKPKDAFSVFFTNVTLSKHPSKFHHNKFISTFIIIC